MNWVQNSYDKFSKTFSKSRKNMKWEELDFFIKFLPNIGTGTHILDIWCGNGRLLNYLKSASSEFSYLWIDSSSGMIKEAKKEYPDYDFQVLSMTDIDKLDKKFDYIFLIASFHHLETEAERVDVLNKIKKILNKWWLVLMTNWNLLGEENFEKYKKEYSWNWDFNIKIWKYSRYYHGFKLEELEELFNQTWFKITENRVFEWGRNIVSIIK